MAAAQWAQQRRSTHTCAQAVGPGAGGIDHGAGSHSDLLATQNVLHDQTGDAALHRLQAVCRSVIHQNGAVALCFE